MSGGQEAPTVVDPASGLPAPGVGLDERGAARGGLLLARVHAVAACHGAHLAAHV